MSWESRDFWKLGDSWEFWPALNISLGKFDLTGIPPAPRGDPQIEVTFEINSDGILKVSAVEKGSGSTSDIKIDQNGNRPSQEEIEEMIRQAEIFKMEDEEMKARITAR